MEHPAGQRHFRYCTVCRMLAIHSFQSHDWREPWRAKHCSYMAADTGRSIELLKATTIYYYLSKEQKQRNVNKL